MKNLHDSQMRIAIGKLFIPSGFLQTISDTEFCSSISENNLTNLTIGSRGNNDGSNMVASLGLASKRDRI